MANVDIVFDKWRDKHNIEYVGMDEWRKGGVKGDKWTYSKMISKFKSEYPEYKNVEVYARGGKIKMYDELEEYEKAAQIGDKIYVGYGLAKKNITKPKYEVVGKNPDGTIKVRNYGSKAKKTFFTFSPQSYDEQVMVFSKGGKITGAGKSGLDKIKKTSKDNPNQMYKVTDDNYSNIGNFYLKNGKFAKMTVSNADYDFAYNKVSLRPKRDVIYKATEIEGKGGYYAKGGSMEVHHPIEVGNLYQIGDTDYKILWNDGRLIEYKTKWKWEKWGEDDYHTNITASNMAVPNLFNEKYFVGKVYDKGGTTNDNGGNIVTKSTEIEKFDDVYIKSKNLSGMVYEIKDKEVIVNTLKEGLIKTQINDLKKI